MSEPFIAEIRIFAGNFAPRGWAFCDGQLLPIANNAALFSLIGTTYGGDGRTTTALPNLQGRAPMQPGSGPGLTRRFLGERTGVEQVVLVESQLPNHNHNISISNGDLDTITPSSNTLLTDKRPIYQTSSAGLTFSSELTSNGGGQSHNNVQPYLTLNFIIALQGLFPSRG